jgi:hypothetical protein
MLYLNLFLDLVDRFEVVVGAVRLRRGGQVERCLDNGIDPFWQRRYSIHGVMSSSLPVYRLTGGQRAQLTLAMGLQRRNRPALVTTQLIQNLRHHLGEPPCLTHLPGWLVVARVQPGLDLRSQFFGFVAQPLRAIE